MTACDLFAPHHAYGGPDGSEAARRCAVTRAASPCCSTWCTTTSVRPAITCRASAPIMTHHYATPWGDAVNFDGRGSDEVRRLFCDNALMWLRDYHFDGLRIDAVHAIIDTLGDPFPRTARERSCRAGT